jgi:hypothetical protein
VTAAERFKTGIDLEKEKFEPQVKSFSNLIFLSQFTDWEDTCLATFKGKRSSNLSMINWPVEKKLQKVLSSKTQDRDLLPCVLQSSLPSIPSTYTVF